MGFIFIHSGPDMSFFQYFGMLGLRQLMCPKYCIFGPLNLHLLSLQFCYFLIFSVSFGVLIFL
jgi:hypothetical protein